ncbi:hypothetical protein ACHAXT_013362 [Thalassiosira profunda]
MCAVTPPKRRLRSAMAPTSSSCQESRPKRRRLEDGVDAAVPSPSPKTPLHESHSASKPSSAPRRRRRVSFAPTADVLVVPRWTPHEHEAAWYTTLDVALFRLQECTDAARLRQAIAAKRLPPDNVFLYRGLERQMSAHVLEEIKERRRRVAGSVLVEQARQRRSGRKVLDHERVAEASTFYSDEAAVWALTVASL